MQTCLLLFVYLKKTIVKYYIGYETEVCPVFPYYAKSANMTSQTVTLNICTNYLLLDSPVFFSLTSTSFWTAGCCCTKSWPSTNREGDRLWMEGSWQLSKRVNILVTEYLLICQQCLLFVIITNKNSEITSEMQKFLFFILCIIIVH